MSQPACIYVYIQTFIECVFLGGSLLCVYVFCWRVSVFLIVAVSLEIEICRTMFYILLSISTNRQPSEVS